MPRLSTWSTFDQTHFCSIIFAPKIPLFTLFPFLNNHVGNSRPVANGHQNLLRSLFLVALKVQSSHIIADVRRPTKTLSGGKKETSVLDLGKAMMLGKSDQKQNFILPDGGIWWWIPIGTIRKTITNKKQLQDILGYPTPSGARRPGEGPPPGTAGQKKPTTTGLSNEVNYSMICLRLLSFCLTPSEKTHL